MRATNWILLCGALLSVVPAVVQADTSGLRPKARPAVASAVAAPQAAVATPAEAVVQVASVSGLRPRSRPTAVQARATRDAQAVNTQTAAVVPASARVSTRAMTPRAAAQMATIVESRRTQAVQAANSRRAKGQRVWCVPFARDLSGVSLQGNAHTWWGKAAGVYERSKSPVVGAVMHFQSTRKMPLGHVAVVSKVESSRRVQIDHANWTRNKISLGMVVVDVSSNNDWSRVRVESSPGTLGHVYPVSGFILASKS